MDEFPFPAKKKLRTGEIQWDEEALKKAREQMPSHILMQYAPYMVPGIGLLGGGGMMAGKGLLNLLRDPRLEMMFARGLIR
jgi:hypothetical protein